MDHRPMGFETDVSNQNFVGAGDPNKMLFVQFYWHEPEDMNKSMELGKLVRGPKMPYIRIQKPGDKTSIVETPVRDDHKARFPEEWLRWQMQEGLIDGTAGDIPGWKIEEWNQVNPDQVRELKYLRFYVVEQIAGATDDQVQRMGMGGLGLREQARQALRARMGAEVKEELQKKDAEIAQLKAADAAKEERLKRLETALLAKPVEAVPYERSQDSAVPKSKRKYTRRAKPEATA